MSASTNATIEEALESDVPEMTTVQCLAMEADALTSFLVGRQHAEAVQEQTESLSVLRKKDSPIQPTDRCHIHKAVDTQSGELVGWSLVRWEDGSKLVVAARDRRRRGKTFSQFIDERSSETGSRSRMQSHMSCSAACTPGLIDRAVESGDAWSSILYSKSEYNLSKEPVVVQTRASAEGFKLKMGWQTVVVCAEIDLSRWAGGPGSGYGTHRSPQMLRSPNTK